MSCRIAVARCVAGRAIVLLHVATLVAVTACQGATGTRATSAPLARSARDILVASEIARYTNVNLYEVLQAARPFWISNQGKPPSVSIDGGPPTGVDFLRLVLAADVQEVQFLHSFSEARVRPTVLPNGTVEYRNLIVVITRIR
jgi:hypothetical protein